MDKNKISQEGILKDQEIEVIAKRTDERTFLIKEAVTRAVQEYGETLKKLAKDD